ncbi:MAG TPA: HAD-IA family hydrolase [Candidatus Limnocylindrales bacterium]|nr:HAD-IA family hydrolase [Candidatus Limnocylindrales bacterium]
MFDLDGVIVDSEIWWDEARRDFARAHGRAWTIDDRHAVMGANSGQWSATMRERLALDLDAATIEAAVVDAMVERYAREGPPTIDGAVEAVRRIADGRATALASSSHRRVIDAALAATDLAGVFRAVVSSDDVAHGKPAPDVFLEAARRLGADPASTLVVEDSLNGLRAARAAGMTTVLVPNHSVPPADGAETFADLVIARLRDLDVDALGAGGAEAGAPDPAPVAAAYPPPILTSGGAPIATPAVPSGGPAANHPSVPWGPDGWLAAGPHGTDGVHPFRRTLRAWLSRIASWLIVRAYLRLRIEGRDRLPGTPAIYCFNHLSWADPFLLMAILPMRPRLTFFGPKEEDMSVGGRNRLMTWTGATIPYRPGKDNLIEATRRVHAVLAAGGVIAIAGEGRIQPFESQLRPLNEGAAYFALRERVPLVPIAIHGTSWLAFGRRARVVVGEPLAPAGRPNRENVDALTARCWAALHELVRDEPERARPGPIGRWVSEQFNDWPEGDRAAAEAAARAAADEPPGDARPSRS